MNRIDGTCSRHHEKTALTCAALLFMASLTQSAHAQAAAAALPADAAASAAVPAAKEAANTAKDTQVVTVTATLRREPAREVPMQVDILSTEKLEQGGAKSLGDVLGAQPGIDVKTGGVSGAISIRGVSTGDQTIATVGTYIDNVAFGSSSAFVAGASTSLEMQLLDLNHIEVLRGPQGTLYGAGAMGGLLKYVTNEPDSSELSGKVTVGVATTVNGRVGNTESGVVNVPIRENVAAFRVSAFRDHVGGFIDAIGPAAGRAVNGGDTTGARVSLLIEPSNRASARLTATTQDAKRDGADVVDYSGVTGQPVYGSNSRGIAVREPNSMRTTLLSADIEYDLDWARLYSITSVQRSDYFIRQDLTNTYVPLLSSPDEEFGTAVSDLSAHLKKTTQEFRLTSKSGGQFEWLAGLFYDHESGRNSQLASSTLADGSAGPDLAVANLPSSYIEKAFYGDATWNFSRDLAVTGGLRVARNNQYFGQVSSGLLLGGSANLSGTSRDTSKTFLLTAKYALDATSNVYARAASGYRPGGPNAVIRNEQTGLPEAPPTFQHDTLWSYEAGYKADLLDKTLSIESALYDIRWKQIQQLYAVNGEQVIVNGGRAAVDGLELSAKYHPHANWALEGGLAAVNARLVQDAPGLASSGARLPNTAKFSASTGANYLINVGPYSGYAGATERFVGERNAGFDGSATLPNFRMPPYFLTDLQAGMAFGSIDVGLYVRNAFNRVVQLDAATGLMAIGGPALVTPARPRTVGLNVTASF
jgi:iron complex outermembrane recepter protein